MHHIEAIGLVVPESFGWRILSGKLFKEPVFQYKFNPISDIALLQGLNSDDEEPNCKV